jgi:hypothetical protein
MAVWRGYHADFAWALMPGRRFPPRWAFHAWAGAKNPAYAGLSRVPMRGEGALGDRHASEGSNSVGLSLVPRGEEPGRS